MHLVAAREQRIDDVRADEARSSGDHRPHGPILRSMFVTFEGMDGSGKTTQVERLRAALEADGHEVVTAREPGQTVLGEEIRNLVLHGGPMTPWAEALLYAASRAEVVAEVVRPALERGADVLLDRYLDSSIVYQGIGRGLGVDEVLEVNLLATGGLLPDRPSCSRSSRGRRPRASARSRTGSNARTRTSTSASQTATRSSPPSSRTASSSSTARSIRTCSQTGSSMSFDDLPEQPEASRLLRAAVDEGPAHAYLLHGPAGVGKRAAARTFAAELLGDERRVAAGTHPDLFLLEALGEMIRIDEIRALHRDLHMRPYEADRRVYVIADAHLLNEDAADALLKDLEEPPSYAVIVLVADELGPIPATIRSRCQLVPFRRLPERAVRAFLAERAPGLSETEARRSRASRAVASIAPSACSIPRLAAAATSCCAWRAPPTPIPSSTRPMPRRRCSTRPGSCGAAARERAEAELAGLELTAREAEQRLRRVQRGAEREELLASLEELASWYRDLVVVAAGAEQAAVHADRLDVLREDATRDRAPDAETAAELARDAWRALEEFNLNPALALEALFVQLDGRFQRITRLK